MATKGQGKGPPVPKKAVGERSALQPLGQLATRPPVLASRMILTAYS